MNEQCVNCKYYKCTNNTKWCMIYDAIKTNMTECGDYVKSTTNTSTLQKQSNKNFDYEDLYSEMFGENYGNQ